MNKITNYIKDGARKSSLIANQWTSKMKSALAVIKITTLSMDNVIKKILTASLILNIKHRRTLNIAQNAKNTFSLIQAIIDVNRKNLDVFIKVVLVFLVFNLLDMIRTDKIVSFLVAINTIELVLSRNELKINN